MRIFITVLVVLGMLLSTSSPALATHPHKKSVKHKHAHVRTHVRKKHARHHSSRHTSHAYAPSVYGSSQLAQEINRIIYPVAAKTNVGIFVKSMQRGDILYARDTQQTFVPASIMKIMTAETALLFLGPDYRFTTQVLTDAKSINNGVLQGNLYIVQSGDPSLNYTDLVRLLVSLRDEDVHTITGNVYVDQTAFDANYYGPGWIQKDKNLCYGSPISASIINHNCLNFKMAPTRAGNYAHVVTYPQYFYPGFHNNVLTKSRGRGCGLRLSTDSDSAIALNGCIPRGRYAWGISYVIGDIPGYNLSLFRNLLRNLNIQLKGNVTFGSAASRLYVLSTHQSKPLSELVHEMMKKSDNIIAGAIFKKIGQLYSRRQGSWETGGMAVKQILSQRTGMSTSGMRAVDGSGISRNNTATPAQMMRVLEYAYHDATSNAFISSLPIAGIDGTLKHRMGNITRKVRAKTGSLPMTGVVSLAGYTMTANKEPLAFVIMINGRPGLSWRYKTLEDKIATALTRYQRG